MAFTLSEYFKKQGLEVVESSLRAAAGKPTSYVNDDAQYRQAVIQPGWEALPAAIRMLMKREYKRWTELYFALRDEVYDLHTGKVQFHASMSDRVSSLVRYFLTSGEEKSTPMGPTRPNSGTGPSVPLAQPVSASDPLILLAQPVGLPDRAPATGSGAPALRRTNGVADKKAGTGPAVGIDLGTTFSVIAYVDAQGRPCSCLNGDGERLTPSVVMFEEEGTVVGKQALLGALVEPEKTADCVKRDMGGKVYRRKINGEYMPPEVISSFVLRSLKADAERQLGPIRKAVITVPAYFDETRRRATVDAGRLAGLQVLDIINEPTAAAIAYGYHLGFLDQACQLAREQPLRVLVFDLGGGTFDVTIVEIQKNAFKALATDGDVCLGGKDWDEKLVEMAAEQFRCQFREDPRDNPVSLQELWLAAESAKRTLTERPKAVLYVNHLGSRLKVEITRPQFEKATAALLERTRMTTEIVVRQAGLNFADLDRILLVGGSTRMPMIVRMLEELTGKTPDRSISVDEAVAHGAALYAQHLAPPLDPDKPSVSFSVTNINSHSLGIQGTDVATGTKVNKILIPKNTPLPFTVTKRFKTFKPNQRSVVIKVLEGESAQPKCCTRVGVCAIKQLPPDLPAGWPVNVSYTYETNGRLHVAAKLKGHDAAITTDFLRENSLPDEDLEMWAHYVEEETAKNI
jgi:molecular chaperone DnaK